MIMSANNVDGGAGRTIKKAAEDAAAKGRDDGHPEVVISCCPDCSCTSMSAGSSYTKRTTPPSTQPTHTFRPISHRITHQPRTKIPRKVQRIPSLIPKASSQSKDQKEQRQREKVRISPDSPGIRRIL